MLVCSVSLRPLRRAIAAELAEAATAADATATGNIVFATLVDDPANVRDTVDAYLGEIMLEPASAADVVEAGLDLNAAVDESASAAAVEDGAVPATYTDSVTEAVTAADAPDASIAAATAVTTTSMPGPLFMFDTTFPSATLTVINVGR
jgi:hypothetical protein